MRGRIGGRIGATSPPSSYAASGMFRLSEVYSAVRGAYGGGGEYGGGGWPIVSFSVAWPSSGWPSYEEVNYADATADGTATFDARVSSSPSGLAFNYFWEKSTNSGSSWSLVGGSGGSGATSAYDYYGTSVTLSLTGQTVSDNGILYRLVVDRPLKQVRSTPGTLRFDTVSANWEYQPSSQFANAGQYVEFYAGASIVGNTHGATYTASSFQWQRSSDGGSTWANIGGSAGSLGFTASHEDNNSRYRLSVTFGSQAFYSNAATLIVS